MSEIDLKYAIVKSTFYLKVIGTLKIMEYQSIDRFCINEVKRNALTEVVIDIREAEYLDSTAIGLLANLASELFTLLEIKPSLLCFHNDVLKLFMHLGLDQVFHIIESHKEQVDSLMLLPSEEESEKEFAERTLRAHQALINLSDENKSRFNDVVENLKKELNQG